MMFSRGKWLLVIHLLLGERGVCRAAPPPLPTTPGDTPLPQQAEEGDKEVRLKNPDPATEGGPDPEEMARHLAPQVGTRLQRRIRHRVHLRGNVSCQELLSASAMDDPLSSAFPQELLGLSLVPVLVAAGCPAEARTLVLRLYRLLGEADTEELLADVQDLMERRPRKAAPPPASGLEGGTGRHMEAVMFNIERLAGVGGEPAEPEASCDGWTRVNRTKLVGAAEEEARGRLEEALDDCERVGALCAGVTGGPPLAFRAVLKRGSRILPSDAGGSWIRRCGAEPRRARRSSGGPEGSCVNRGEERVYNVVEWIPAVSTLYNLGTAVYYASVNCSETAKERAILSAVDLGTDALMVATGGTAGVAGYALGAGVKTGVKAGVRYLLSSMKQEDDLLVNQLSWEDGVLTIQ